MAVVRICLYESVFPVANEDRGSGAKEFLSCRGISFFLLLSHNDGKEGKTIGGSILRKGSD
ncbi:hypothetical protein CHM34_14905 [Paludifilum halophilum]|uniref:Uncharacterized protein n=1 Tax=Paludifilum halophilum TaxID=1642702 RepID=A0A235B5G1_9BACL|nr:hypothetical protein CHM34_14905 [Paludifilum halophilum]